MDVKQLLELESMPGRTLFSCTLATVFFLLACWLAPDVRPFYVAYSGWIWLACVIVWAVQASRILHWVAYRRLTAASRDVQRATADLDHAMRAVEAHGATSASGRSTTGGR